jgi:hypothetical protein
MVKFSTFAAATAGSMTRARDARRFMDVLSFELVRDEAQCTTVLPGSSAMPRRYGNRGRCPRRSLPF